MLQQLALGYRLAICLVLVTLLGACAAQAPAATNLPATQPGSLPTTPTSAALPTTSAPLTTTSGLPVLSYRIIKAYPHDPTAFTQGLVIDNGVLYEGTGIEGQSRLRRVDLETGAVLQEQKLPDEVFGEGITIVGDRIIQLTWLSQIGYVYDRATLTKLEEWRYPTEGWGITYDGSQLIMSDGTATLRLLDPKTFAELGRLEVRDLAGPVANLNELEYIDGAIYANIWQTDKLAQIDPTTGQVRAWIDLTGLLSPADRVQPVDVLNGIAYDQAQKRLFVTGKLWPKLFEIELVKP